MLCIMTLDIEFGADMVYTQHTNYIDRFCEQSSWTNVFLTSSIDVDSNTDGITNLFFSYKTKKKGTDWTSTPL